MEDSLHLRIMIIAPTPYFSDRGCHVRIYEESKALRQLGNYVFICTYHLGKDTDDIPIYRTLRIPFYKRKRLEGSKYFVEILGLPPEKVIPVDDGVNTDLIRPDYDVSGLKKEIGLGDDKRILLYLGILTKYQGIDLMIEAMKYLAQKRNDFIFLIVGFPNVEYYCEMAKNLEVSDHVKLTGRIGQERVPQFLCLGEIGLTAKTSATEANGKVLSYMAAGLPVVAIDTPVNRELIGDYGTYSKNPDPQSFAEAIDDLFHDEKRLEYLKRSVRGYVEKNWTWMRSTEHIIRIYKSLLN